MHTSILKHSYLIFSFIVLFSCDSKTEKPEKAATVNEEQSKNISANDIENLKYVDYILSGDSRKVVGDWQKYLELNNQIEFLKKGDLSFFNGEKTVLKTFIRELKTEIPEVINTEVIQSRLTALETKLLKLNSIINLDNISKEEQLESVKEFLVASANLNLQINKKLELDANNVSRPQ